jgi:hypothetical protein
MTPVPVETTERLWADYTVLGREHTVMIRGQSMNFPQSGPTVMQQDLWLILDHIKAALWGSFSVLRIRYAPAGSTITLPAYMSTELQDLRGVVASPPTAAEVPVEHIWVGRSPLDGRKSRFSLYGVVLRSGQFNQKYRLIGLDHVLLTTSCVALMNGITSSFRTITGSNATWYEYVNQNNNSYWESRARV